MLEYQLGTLKAEVQKNNTVTVAPTAPTSASDTATVSASPTVGTPSAKPAAGTKPAHTVQTTPITIKASN